MSHPNEFLLRLALAIIAATGAMVVGALIGRWWTLLALPANVATLRYGRPVTEWLLDDSEESP